MTMASTEATPQIPNLVFFMDDEAYERLGPVWRHLCVGLVDLPISIRLVTPSAQAGELALGPVEVVHHERWRWPFRKSRLNELLDTLSAKPPHLVHALSGGSYPLAVAVARHFDAELILHLTAFRDVEAVLDLPDTARLHLIAATGSLKDEVERHERISRLPTVLVRPGVLCEGEVSCFVDDERMPTLLCTSPLERGSGVDTLIEALGLLGERCGDTMTFLLGGGSQEPAIRKQVARSRLLSQVTFARPIGSRRAVMQGADIYIIPAPETALTATSLQAMGSGMAVIAAEGSVGDFHISGHTAVVHLPQAPAALAEAIESLLSNHPLARRLAEGALAHVKKYHAMSAMAEQTYSLYHELMVRRTTFSLSK